MMMRRSTTSLFVVCVRGVCVCCVLMCVRQKYLAASYNSYYISRGDLLHNS
jgi:hypothetical protein